VVDTVYRRGSSEQLGRDRINLLQNATPRNVSVLEIDTSMNVDLHIFVKVMALHRRAAVHSEAMCLYSSSILSMSC
jgi:hypothetical protein